LTAAPPRKGLLVLAYHAISPTWHDPLCVPPDTFRAQLRRLADAGYRSVSVRQAASGTATGRRVAITFDDAFESAARVAKPILDELGWTATVFVPTRPVTTREPMRWLGGGIARRPEEDAELRAMSWRDVELLAAAGWEVGSHSRTHRRLSELPDDELTEELEGSRRELVDHVGRCDAVSYPWGEVVPRVVAAARRAGYSAGSGLGGRFRFGDPMAVPRVVIAREDGARGFALKTAPAMWLLRSTAAWTLAERARTILRG
jgi:peptidoglycan/xylan/chitin deacetylase (PgdA/CDA1 family)